MSATPLYILLLSKWRWLLAGAFHGSLGVVPPGPGPATTLLQTDIESSTSLWEALPAAIMDAAIKIHNTTIRRLAAEHNGYESLVCMAPLMHSQLPQPCVWYICCAAQALDLQQMIFSR